MISVKDICTLDYLIGTLSTAYKGVINALAVKDFCMTETGNAVVLKGTVLSMPEGNYEASLIQKGIELARTALVHGYFELSADAERIKQARDLQIDIIQTGRHIGTFLLKKESSAGFYMSAIELSGELRNLDLRLLTAPLKNKVGLLRKAEEIITALLSPKKDWANLSERLHGFATDFFWTARESFPAAFPILTHFLMRSAERAGTSKPVSNFLDSIELPLEHEQDGSALRSVCEAWLAELNSTSADLSLYIYRCVSILRSIDDRSPGSDIGPGLARLVHSVREKLLSLPVLPPSVYDQIRRHAEPEIYSRLALYSAAVRQELLKALSQAEQDWKKAAYARVLDFLFDLDADLMGDEVMTRTFFEGVVAKVAADSAEPFTGALTRFFSLLPVLSPRALETIRSGIPAFIEKLISFERSDLCGGILRKIDNVGPLRESIILDQVVAGSVLRSRNDALIRRYVQLLTGIVVPPPRVREISAETWAEVVNPLHLERLGRFLDILQLGGDQLREVCVHLIANLFITGVFIPDDRLFQRRISSYLNSAAMQWPFLLNFLLLERLPVYYNEIGAVSRIRDYSTEIDSWGNDPALYFVRKQVHVNASNYNIRLLEKMISCWVSNDASLLRDAVPPDVYAGLKPGMFERYSNVIRPLFYRLGVLDAGGLHFDRIVRAPEHAFPVQGGRQVAEIPAKVMLLCRLYQEIVKKYDLGKSASPDGSASAMPEMTGEMRLLLGTIMRRERTAPAESLYFKRHIAFGIPSVLGTYHEPKFDSLSEFLRIGARARLLLENAIEAVNAAGSSFTSQQVRAWLDSLAEGYHILKLHGLENPRIEESVAVIEHNDLHLSQLADLLKIWQKELAWLVRFLNQTFHPPLARIITALPKDDLPQNLLNLDPDRPDYVSKAADIILRDVLAEVPCLTESDRMIEALLGALHEHIERIGDNRVTRSRSTRAEKFFVIQEMTDQDASRLGPVIGGKAKNLVYLRNRGFQVPPGVVLPVGQSDRERDLLLREAVRELEKRTGSVFGDQANPLFLSVRSGSYVSMPGILSTILYCGMNDDTVRGFSKATRDPRLAFDSYRRFIEQYAATVLGLDIGLFERITAGLRDRPGADTGSQPSGLERLIERYKEELKRRDRAIPGDVYEQLSCSVRAVSESWNSLRAEQFRKATRTSGHWGTSVTLMQMVCGNAEGSGASVFFTRDPFTSEPRVYGETREAATGEDLVRGARLGRPLSRSQSRFPALRAPENSAASLEETDPELFALHQDLARSIEQAMGLPQEVEVTYVRQPDGSRKFFVLQTRRMEPGADQAMQFDRVCAMESRVIARGTGAHGGAISGAASFADTAEQIIRLREKTSLPVILIRTTASTDDVSLMPLIRGIVTSSGGVTSHAAVLAQKFRVNAVVACSDIEITTDERQRYARSGRTIIREGSEISIDGSTGLVFSGLCPEIEPEVRL